ncbi:MAG: hypothetical protein RBT13_04510, partial [Bacteroidales bacterium]|nr:hypothetical protein [Bacteroidales bacterium]
MKIKNILLSVILIFTSYLTHAQVGSACPNLNFSLGNFNNWVCKISSSQGATSTAYGDLTWTGSVAVG